MTDDSTAVLANTAPDANTMPTQHERDERAVADSQPSQHVCQQLMKNLAQWYPKLFGPVLVPLKRGIFQDLKAAYPDTIDAQALKWVLARHTRSTRYLSALASGQPRHDLQGQPVEAVAPEHVHHALREIFRRRQRRTQEDLTPLLRRRIAYAFEASGLTREAYAALVHNRRDEQANVLLHEVLAEVAASDAKAEALLRAWQASGAGSVAQFADMYGIQPRVAARQLERAQRLLQGTQHVAETP